MSKYYQRSKLRKFIFVSSVFRFLSYFLMFLKSFLLFSVFWCLCKFMSVLMSVYFRPNNKRSSISQPLYTQGCPWSWEIGSIYFSFSFFNIFCIFRYRVHRVGASTNNFSLFNPFKHFWPAQRLISGFVESFTKCPKIKLN